MNKQPVFRSADREVRRFASFKISLVLIAPLVLSLVNGVWSQDKMIKPPNEPEIISIFPLGGQKGTTFSVEIKGRTLSGAYGVWFSANGLEAQIKKVEAIELPEKKRYAFLEEAEKSKRGYSVLLQIKIDPTTTPGTHFIRLISPRGISNTLGFQVISDPIIQEIDIPHDTPDRAQPIPTTVVVDGKISKPGERDFYQIDASRGEELAFELISSREAVAAGFRPQLGLYEITGSWFDPHRATRLGFNDAAVVDINREKSSLPVPTSRLSYRFSKVGRYVVEVESSFGTGAPDFAYQLKVGLAGHLPIPQQDYSTVYQEWSSQLENSEWRERTFTRKIKSDRIGALRSRSFRMPKREIMTGQGKSSSTSSDIKTDISYEDTDLGTITALAPTLSEKEPNEMLSQAMEISVPAIVEGIIEHPGDIDTFKFKVKPNDRLAFEIETPNAAPLRFNPRLDILDADGGELLTNMRKTNNEKDSTTELKALEPKVIYTFNKGGECYLQIRDITSRYGVPDYQYRVLVRLQIPHMGEVQVKEDRVNLVPGEAKELTVIIGQEEGFFGEVALLVEGLPQGVKALPGTKELSDKRRSEAVSVKEESYVPKIREGTIVLFAEESALPTTIPQLVRLTAKPIVEGKPGLPLLVGEILLMVVRRTEGELQSEGRLDKDNDMRMANR